MHEDTLGKDLKLNYYTKETAICNKEIKEDTNLSKNLTNNTNKLDVLCEIATNKINHSKSLFYEQTKTIVTSQTHNSNKNHNLEIERKKTLIQADYEHILSCM